jgi:bisphosphoglycerate-dependent phosphoglycerate mutase
MVPSSASYREPPPPSNGKKEDSDDESECLHVRKQGREYAEATSIHGIRYACEEGRTIVERLVTYFNKQVLYLWPLTKFSY